MRFDNFHAAILIAQEILLAEGEEVDAGSWQGYDTEGKPDLVTKEILNLTLEVPVYQATGEGDDDTLAELQDQIQPNLPWADDHFEERVSRDPTNPGAAYKNWPWWQGQSAAAMVAEPHQTERLFTHTYQERFWAKDAWLDAHAAEYPTLTRRTTMGIRYDYGDLDDVVNLLAKRPWTRQAYLPIFFPEDTGASHGGRIPCTLGYHFVLRNNLLHMWYHIRSCDMVRHFRDDLYLACRLLLWVIQELQERELREDPHLEDPAQLWVGVRPGTLFFTAYSFHAHKGDLHHVKS